MFFFNIPKCVWGGSPPHHHHHPAFNRMGTAVQAGALLQVANSVSSLIKYKNQDVENMWLKW